MIYFESKFPCQKHHVNFKIPSYEEILDNFPAAFPVGIEFLHDNGSCMSEEFHTDMQKTITIKRYLYNIQSHQGRMYDLVH